MRKIVVVVQSNRHANLVDVYEIRGRRPILVGVCFLETALEIYLEEADALYVALGRI